MSSSAAYNFVPPPDSIHPAEPAVDFSRYHPDRITGYIDYICLTETPTYTRAAKSMDSDGDHVDSDFFHRFDAKRTPVLPGSSLRGMVRNVFEIITKSRLDFVTHRNLYYRTFAERGNTGMADFYNESFDINRLVGGVLREHQGKLLLDVSSAEPKGFVAIAAIDPGLTSLVPNPFTAVLVHITSTGGDVTLLRGAHAMSVPLYSIASPGTLGVVEAWFIQPGPVVSGQRRYYQAILVPNSSTQNTFVVPNEVMRDYLEWGAMAHGTKWRTKAAGVPRVLEDGKPAFAMIDSDEPAVIDAIGANMMLHLRYENSPYDTIKASKKERNIIDYTQRVFGYVPDGAGDAIRGRLRFEDAICLSDNPWLANNQLRIPDVTLSPKPTAVQMYVQQAAYGIRHWDTDKSKARGFKRYWHQNKESAYDNLSTVGNAPATGDGVAPNPIRPVREGIEFRGRIWFENLTRAEFGALYASLFLPKDLRHKIGMGKSLGLGTIYVTVKRVALFDMRDRYQGFGDEPGKVDIDPSKLIRKDSYWSFVDAVYPGKYSLWEDDRTKALAILLSFKDITKRHELTQQRGVDHPQWRARDRLPYPAECLYNLNAAWPDDILGVRPGERPVVKPITREPPREQIAILQTSIGDRIKCLVVGVNGDGRTGSVRLPDGTELANQVIGVSAIDKIIKMKVLAVTKAGNAITVSRA